MVSKHGVFRRLKYAAEYAALRALSAVIGLLPEKLAVRAGVMLGRALRLIGRRRRRIARENIKKAMPGEHTAEETRRLVKEVFVNISLTAVESLWMRSRVTKENIGTRCRADGADTVAGVAAEGRGAILCGPHLGNWEFFGAWIAARFGGVAALARPVNNPMVREYTTRLREDFGITVLSTRDGVRPMIAALKRGEFLAVLIDQHVNRAFVPATFFARKAATTAVVASLALKFDTPVFTGYSVRDGHSFRHHAHFEGPIELVRSGDHEADVLANTQRFNDKLEEIIREHPEQWLWTHRRWKLADRLERGSQKEEKMNVR
ncbi:MAG: lysophospholipid acyltransferase family protein [Planctomycetota bacterium]